MSAETRIRPTVAMMMMTFGSCDIRAWDDGPQSWEPNWSPAICAIFLV